MKPILFNTDMVRAILDDRKIVTRRVVKPQPVSKSQIILSQKDNGTWFWWSGGVKKNELKPPYRSGDILYVRETWCKTDCFGMQDGYVYKANDNSILENTGFTPKWRPSIHMPREAARIFLRVTDVRVERLQDITDEEARREGCKDRDDFRCVWNNCYAKPQPVKIKGVIDHYESYPWEDIQETRTYQGKPWYVIGNPWVWSIEFERISRRMSK